MGWQRKILRVDLSKGTAESEPLNMDWAFDYLGERGLGTKYLMENMDPKADALGPDNVLIFATGPLTGTMASTSGRYAVDHQGPADRGDRLLQLRRQIRRRAEVSPATTSCIVEGRAAKEPCLPAHRRRHGGDPAGRRDLGHHGLAHRGVDQGAPPEPALLKVASIGVAGEEGVRFACVVNDLHRAAGRSGVGAVMGSKNLKAVAVPRHRRGQGRGPQGLHGRRSSDGQEAAGGESGPAGADGARHQRHDRPDAGVRRPADPQLPGGAVRGHRQDQPGGHGRSAPNGHKNLVANKACFGCTIACGRIAHIDKHALHHRQPQGILACLGRARVRDRLCLRAGGRGRRHRRADLRRLPDERARHGPDLLRRHPGRRHGALRERRSSSARTDRRHRAEVRQRRGAHRDGREDRQARGLRQGARPRLQAACARNTAIPSFP